MDSRNLGQLVQHYLRCSLAPSTRRTYAAAQRRYLEFCGRARLPPLPTSETTLCSFAAAMAGEGLKHKSIKGYLSAVRNLQIMSGQGDPFDSQMPLLDYVLRGIKSEQAKHGPAKRERLPITPTVLLKLRAVWAKEASKPDHIMLWAACCTCFFGFLRSGEVTVPSAQGYDPGAHLSVGDVSLDSIQRPKTAQVRIKASKTDPFRHGVSVFLGRTDSPLCPVAALAAYLAVRGLQKGPFFRFEDGKPLTRERLVVCLRKALSLAGLDPHKYAGHSFRSGAATTAAACGLQDSLIQTLGRWKSSAYLLYVQIHPERLASVSRSLATAGQGSP